MGWEGGLTLEEIHRVKEMYTPGELLDALGCSFDQAELSDVFVEYEVEIRDLMENIA